MAARWRWFGNHNTPADRYARYSVHFVRGEVHHRHIVAKLIAEIPMAFIFDALQPDIMLGADGKLCAV
jgi:hypothetical protein